VVIIERIYFKLKVCSFSRLKMQDQRYVHDNDDEWSDDDEECNNNISVEQDGLSLDTSNTTGSGCNIRYLTNV
jgi:hypothetical protein